MESGFNIKLIENNEMIGKLFNVDKFPLLLELNESEEVNKFPKKFFLITRLQSESFILIFYGCIVGRKRYSYCNDIEELVAMVLHLRSQETNDVDIKLGVDGWQGFLKVTINHLKPEL